MSSDRKYTRSAGVTREWCLARAALLRAAESSVDPWLPLWRSSRARWEAGGGGGRQGLVVLTVRIITKQIFNTFLFLKYKRLNQIKCTDVQCMLWVTAD